jgi:hypothetical protein
MASSEDDLRRTRDRLESSIDRLGLWMIAFTAIVAGGLFIELEDPFLKAWNTCDWLPLMGSIGSVLVAVGVAGELFVEYRAHRRENALRAVNAVLENQSQEKLKLADVRIADAERRTAEASLETEKLKAQFAWRHLPIDKMSKLIFDLRSRTGSIWIEYMNGDPESLNFARQFIVLFRIGGWSVGLRGCTGLDLLFGVIIPGPEEGIASDLTTFISEAFARNGYGFNVAAIPRWASAVNSMPPPPEPSARMFIGPKQPLSLESSQYGS